MRHPPKPRPLVFGEVLFDHFPDGSTVLGGAPFNVAWHLAALGQHPLLISRVGDDPLGRRIRQTMQDWGMDTGGLQLDSAHPTGTVEVRIENGEPAFDIVPDRAYDFLDSDAHPPLGPVPLLYHGSLALRGRASRAAFEAIRSECAAPVFLDVNLRPPWWDKAQVGALLDAATWAKLNDKELETLAPAGDDLEARARALIEATGLELLIVTRGAHGALALGRDGRRAEVMPEGTASVVDTVGAGDAFSSVAVLGLLRGWDLETILHRAQEFAGAIVGIRGATPGDRDFYCCFAEKWSLI